MQEQLINIKFKNSCKSFKLIVCNNKTKPILYFVLVLLYNYTVLVLLYNYTVQLLVKATSLIFSF